MQSSSYLSCSWITIHTAALRLLLAIGLMGGASVALGDAKPRHASGTQTAAVEDLPVCYARGTDALGSAVDAVIVEDLNSTINLSDPQFAKGLAFYRSCFAHDFSFTLEFDGVPALTVPDPATRTRDTDAALQWANFVNNAFREPRYQSTQHHMGSISSKVRGRGAQIQSYLIATHVYGADASAVGVNQVGGIYTDEAAREHGHWVIRERTLNITWSVVIPGT